MYHLPRPFALPRIKCTGLLIADRSRLCHGIQLAEYQWIEWVFSVFRSSPVTLLLGFK